MFGTNFRSSILVLPWLLLPLVVGVAYFTVADNWIQANGWAERGSSVESGNGGIEEIDFDEVLEYTDDFPEEADAIIEDYRPITILHWGAYSTECYGLSTILSIIINFMFLLVIPSALGGYDAGKKRGQFYLGFFISLAALIGLPVIYYMLYGLDHTTLIILLGFHAVAFMATFMCGSRFVSMAYRNSFWFYTKTA